MTLVEAMEKAVDGQTISRKYTVPGAGTFTLSAEVEVCDVGRFLVHKWGGKVKLDSLTADNWELVY